MSATSHKQQMSFNKNCCLNGLNDKIMIALEFDQHTCSFMCLTLIYKFKNNMFSDCLIFRMSILMTLCGLLKGVLKAYSGCA